MFCDIIDLDNMAISRKVRPQLKKETDICISDKWLIISREYNMDAMIYVTDIL